MSLLAPEILFASTGFDVNQYNPTVWLKVGGASDFVESGGVVETWLDRSVNGNDFTQSTSGDRPTWASDYVEFNGTNQYLSHSTGILFPNDATEPGSNWDLWLVFECDNITNSFKTMMLGGTGGQNPYLWVDRGNSRITIWRNKFQSSAYDNSGWSNGTKYLLHAYKVGSTSTVVFNGETQTDTDNFNYQFEWDRISGYGGSASYDFDGKYYEIIYAEGLGTSDRTEITNYLNGTL